MKKLIVLICLMFVVPVVAESDCYEQTGIGVFTACEVKEDLPLPDIDISEMGHDRIIKDRTVKTTLTPYVYGYGIILAPPLSHSFKPECKTVLTFKGEMPLHPSRVYDCGHYWSAVYQEGCIKIAEEIKWRTIEKETKEEPEPTIDAGYRISQTRHHYSLTTEQLKTALSMYLEAHHYHMLYGKWTFDVYTKPEDRRFKVTIEEVRE